MRVKNFYDFAYVVGCSNFVYSLSLQLVGRKRF